jgi:glycerophosphoryl diester phosphodiesterase
MQEGERGGPVQRHERPGPLIVAHRGAWGAAPQNSLEAFERAIALGCDGIELDVRRTADGRLVIVHDARVGGRPVARLEHRQLQARMKVGQAPLLEDVLELVAGRITVDVEIKEDGYVDQVMAVVARHLAPDRYVVTSFRDAVLPAVKRARPDARAGLLIGPRLRVRELDRRLRQAGAQFVAPHAALTRRGILAWCAERGLPAWVWTVNDQRMLRRLREDRRVAALITDQPLRALRVSPPVDTVDSRE